jgi:hypothetical protein
MNEHAYITLESKDILTYPFSDPNPVPVITEGLGAVYPIVTEGRGEIYPYHSFTGYSSAGQMQKWDVIKLENDYIEVYILPSIGGKVWGAIEKSTGKEFIYRNEVIKFRNISQRGPWTSGGIEFNFGFIGHHPSTCVQVDYKTMENADGSVSCIVGGLDLPSRTNWRVEIRLPMDKAYFETRAMWNNPTPLPQSYYNWMTAAAVVSDDLEFMYPGTQEIGHDGAAGPWPVDRAGRDLSMYANNAFGSDRSSHMVGEYNHFMGGYYHKSEFGFGHWALYDEMPGHKLWLWSQARSSAIWEDLLTDNNGQYLEFQAGRLFSQYSPLPSLKSPITQVPFAPGLTDHWKEIWFPVKAIGGFVDISPKGVLNVTHTNGKLQLGINALAFIQAKVKVKSNGRLIHSEEINFKPMDVFQTLVPLGSGADYEVTVEGMDLQYSPKKRNLIDRPFVNTMPMYLTTAASLYQEGMELKEARNFNPAKELFKKCLEKDPLYIDALAAITEIYYRSNLYDSALLYANKALQLDTYHPAANYFAGITYLAKGDLINALEALGWAARSLEFRSTAYAQMAGIQLQLDNYELVEHYANQALDYNRYNFNALQVLAILYRKSGKNAQAGDVIESISNIDPLDHFADFERYLLQPSEENLSRFIAAIKNEFPYQTYLELGLVYYGLGLKEETLWVFEKAPSHPLITLWKAYLKDDPALLDEMIRESAAYVFPYRCETAKALAWAFSKNSHWKFKYYLALNYWAIQREEEAVQLLRSCGQEPDYAPFYLTRASLVKSKDEKEELRDLEKAQKLAPDDWRIVNKLIKYHEDNRNHQMALAISSAAYKKFKDNSALGLKYAAAHLNDGQYAACVKVLDGLHVIPAEGSNPGKIIYEQAYLLYALDFIQNKKYAEALQKLEKAREWPESLGVGMPYEPDNRIEDYLSAFCMKKLDRVKEAEALQNEVVNYTLKQFTNPSLNNLLALLVYKEKGDKDAANSLIQKINTPENSDNPVQRWITAVYKNDTAASKKLEYEMSNNNYFGIVKKTAELVLAHNI